MKELEFSVHHLFLTKRTLSGRPLKALNNGVLDLTQSVSIHFRAQRVVQKHV